MRPRTTLTRTGGYSQKGFHMSMESRYVTPLLAVNEPLVLPYTYRGRPYSIRMVFDGIDFKPVHAEDTLYPVPVDEDDDPMLNEWNDEIAWAAGGENEGVLLYSLMWFLRHTDWPVEAFSEAAVAAGMTGEWDGAWEARDCGPYFWDTPGSVQEATVVFNAIKYLINNRTAVVAKRKKDMKALAVLERHFEWKADREDTLLLPRAVWCLYNRPEVYAGSQREIVRFIKDTTGVSIEKAALALQRVK